MASLNIRNAVPSLISTFCKVWVSFVLLLLVGISEILYLHILPVWKLKHTNLKTSTEIIWKVVLWVAEFVVWIFIYSFIFDWDSLQCVLPVLFAIYLWRCVKSSQLLICLLFLPCLILQLIDAGMFLELEHFDYIIKLLRQLQVSSWEMSTVLNIKSRYVFKELFSNYSCLASSSASIFINLCGIFKRCVEWKCYHITPNCILKCCQSTVF